MKQKLFNLSKLLISGALIYFLLKVLDVKRIWLTLQNVNIGYTALAFLCSGFVLPILAFRWKRVLKASEIHVPVTRVLRINLIGICSSNFFPGLFGGDLIRPLYLIQDYQNKKIPLYASVFFERICGFMGILLLGLISGSWLAFMIKERYYILITGVICAGLILTFFFFNWIDISKISLPRFLKRFQSFVHRFYSSFILYAKDGRLLAETVGWSLLSQIISILMYWILLAGTGSVVNPMMVIIAVSLAWLVALIPVSLNGLGLREGSMVYLLTRFGVAPDRAGIAVLLGLLPTVFFSIIGAAMLTSGINLKKIMKEVKYQ
ncbi:MAG: lysylphosphatidylglycerol synthase transmembrane domain-containing protein [Bacteroidota bacterium]